MIRWIDQRTFGHGLLAGGVALTLLTLVKLVFADTIGHPSPFLGYFVAVVIAGWFGGLGSSWVTAMAGGMLAAGVFMPDPLANLWSRTAPQLFVFGLESFVLGAVTAGLAAERRRSAYAAADSQQALAQLYVVMRGVDEGIMVQDASGLTVYANARAAALCGYDSPDEFLRATQDEAILDRFEFYDLNGDRVALEELPPSRLLRGEPAEERLLRVRTRDDGEDRWTVIRSNPVYDGTGKVEHIVNLFRDITDERRRDRALQQSRQWLVTAMRSIGDAVIATDPRGKIMFLNPVAEHLTGWRSDEAEGRALTEVFVVIDEDTREPAPSPVDHALAGGDSPARSDHTLLVRRDASELAIDVSAAQIRDSDGELAGVVLVFRDVSAKRRVAQRREFLMRAVNELNSSLDYRATLTTVASSAVPTIADWCAVDIVEGGRIRRLAVAHIDPEKASLVRESELAQPSPEESFGVANILRTGEPEVMTEIPAGYPRLPTKLHELADRLGLCSYIGVPLRRGSEVFGVISLAMAESRRIYDAADLQLAVSLADRASVAIENAELFARVERARAEAVSANRAKDQFMAMLGHELRNPLAPIITALELMRMQDTETFARERTIIERQVRHVVRLVDDLLDVSRITGGRVELNRVRVDIREVIDKALEMARPLFEQRRQQLETEVGAGLLVDGDPVRLAQVVANLLTNAAKYTEVAGHIAVAARREGDEVVISVRDDGIGIEPAKLQGIFELFVQEPQALDRSQGGLGLGLTIVRGIVDLHGGRVTAASAGHGQGSEFTVHLPVASGVPLPVDPSGSEPNEIPTDGERILLVDDNEDALELLTMLLSNLGYTPHPAADPAEALTVAGRVHPTIAIVDIGLPGIDGYELARRLRKQAGERELRLIALTGYGQPSDRERSREAGFAAHLVKPVNLSELRRALAAA